MEMESLFPAFINMYNINSSAKYFKELIEPWLVDALYSVYLLFYLTYTCLINLPNNKCKNPFYNEVYLQ